MKFIKVKNSALSIRKVKKGEILIGEEIIKQNILIFRGQIQKDISFSKISDINITKLKDIIAKEPEIIILGTGWNSILPPKSLMFSLAKNGIGFESMDTPSACKTYNILLSEDRDVVAILMIK